MKENTLIRRYGIADSAVTVIPHAAEGLAARNQIAGFSDNEDARLNFNRTLVKRALSHRYERFGGVYHNGPDFSYLFFASQHRPSKNIMTLLMAFRFLIKDKYFKLKLVLTSPGNAPEVEEFLREHNLLNDVVFLPRLSENQLAACYALATVAITPSLAEGGMPFTYAEAVSVGTPVLMSDIAVTREILVDPELRAVTLFDPYDWRDMAAKIEWALANREEVFHLQRAFYDDVLSKRDWHDVVAEHIEVMDRISGGERR